jgi:hypothetical protein
LVILFILVFGLASLIGLSRTFATAVCALFVWAGNAFTLRGRGAQAKARHRLFFFAVTCSQYSKIQLSPTHNPSSYYSLSLITLRRNGGD